MQRKTQNILSVFFLLLVSSVVEQLKQIAVGSIPPSVENFFPYAYGCHY